MTPLQQHIQSLTPVQQTIAFAVLAYGPVSVADIGEIVGRPTSAIHTYFSTLRKVLAPIAELVNTGAGYVIRVVGETETEVSLAICGSHTQTLEFREPGTQSKVREPISVEPASTQPHEHEEHTRREKPVKRRPAYRLPWGGFVELTTVVSTFMERNQVVIQLRNGGYIRSPPRANAEVIVEELTTYVLLTEPIDLVNEAAA